MKYKTCVTKAYCAEASTAAFQGGAQGSKLFRGTLTSLLQSLEVMSAELISVERC